MHYSYANTEIERLAQPRAGHNELTFMLGIYLCLCIVLNFLSPWRETNSGLEILFAIVIWLIYTRGSVPRNPGLALVFFFYFGYLLLNFTLGGNLYFLAKLATYPFIILIAYTIGRRLGVANTRRLAQGYLFAFNLLFAVNLILSAKLGLYQSRHLWAFAHVNLAGSYVVGTVIPLTFMIDTGRAKSYFRRLLVVLGALFTRSSGAFLSSLLILIDARKLRFRTAVWYLLTFSLILAAILELGAVTRAPYFTKLNDTAAILRSDNLHELWNLAQEREPLRLLGKGGSGSLSWRLYAYSVYVGAIEQEAPLGFIFGKGAGSYKAVWQGYMPHNDFILVFHDFGLLGELFLLLVVSYSIYKLRHRPMWVIAILALTLRLAFENNIYSDWLIISWSTWIGLSLGAPRKPRRDGNQ